MSQGATEHVKGCKTTIRLHVAPCELQTIINAVQHRNERILKNGKTWTGSLWLDCKEATGSITASLAKAIATRKAAFFPLFLDGFPVANMLINRMTVVGLET